MSDRHAHPGDGRWSLTAPSSVRSIAVIEPDAQEELNRRQWDSVMRDELTTRREPFGFAAALLIDPETGRAFCGYPHARNPRVNGGCDLWHGHKGGHRYRPGAGRKIAIRPTKHRPDAHPDQRPGQEAPSDA